MADTLDPTTATKAEAQAEITKREAAGDFLGARPFKTRLLVLARPTPSEMHPKAAAELAENIAACREAIAAAEDRCAWARAAQEKSRLLRLLRAGR
jgi:hypothetical protein